MSLYVLLRRAFEKVGVGVPELVLTSSTGDRWRILSLRLSQPCFLYDHANSAVRGRRLPFPGFPRSAAQFWADELLHADPERTAGFARRQSHVGGLRQ